MTPPSRVSSHSKDILLKRVTDALRHNLLAHYGVHLPPIVERLPADLPVFEVRARYADLLFRLADGSILHIEFQTTKKPADMGRFMAYSVSVFLAHGVKVYTIVLHGAGITSADDELDAGSNHFRVTNIFIGLHDADLVLRTLQEKLRTGEPLTGVDQADMIMLPLMQRSRSLGDVLREAAEVARTLPRPEKEETVGAMVGMAYHYLEEAEALSLLEVLKMTNVLDEVINESVERGLAQGRELGLAQGRELGLAQGKAEGKAEGLAQGVAREMRHRREALRIVVRKRFGRVPKALDQRIAKADAATLDALFLRALDVDRLELLEK